MSISERGWRHAMYVGARQGWRPARALVLGVGAIGILSAILARLHGLDVSVYARRPASSERAGLIRSLGATYASSSDAGLADLTERDGRPDLILEAAGHSELTAEALQCLAPNGVLCLRGIEMRADRISVPGDLFTNRWVLENKSVIGSTNAARRDWLQGYQDLVEIARRWPDTLAAVIGLTVEPERFSDAISATGPVKATIRFA
jgi:glucose 1-dehydrogenase